MTTAPVISIAEKPQIKAGYNPHVYWVGSRSHPGATHLTNVQTGRCTCPAGKHGRACWHLGVARQLDAFRHQFA
jgi:hypothetical protein